jgi:hypothetical protein
MAFDIFMLCLIAAGYVLFVIGLLNDAARLISEKIWRPKTSALVDHFDYPRARLASKLHAPPPATEKKRKIKQ